MIGGNGEAAKPMPLLQSVLVCDVAVADPSTGKKSLIGIFDKVFVSRFPTARTVSIYIKLVDAQGRYGLTIDFVYSNKGVKLGEAKGEFTAKDALEAVDAHVTFPQLPFTEPGRYEFRVFADDNYLGSAFIDAVPAIASTEEEK